MKLTVSTMIIYFTVSRIYCAALEFDFGQTVIIICAVLENTKVRNYVFRSDSAEGLVVSCR